MAAVIRHGEIIASIILDPIEDDWAIALRGEGAWIERSNGRRSDLRVAPSVPVEQMIGIVNWIFFPSALKSLVTSNLSRVAAAVDYRCAAHQYRLVASGHYDFVL
jgi:fructose-1,6-bisphosphatase/inositol monophosphatase family enzyme